MKQENIVEQLNKKLDDKMIDWQEQGYDFSQIEFWEFIKEEVIPTVIQAMLVEEIDQHCSEDYAHNQCCAKQREQEKNILKNI